MLHQKKPVGAADLTRSFFELSVKDWGLQLLPLSPATAAVTTQLPLSFHRDPADRVIAATAIAHELTLCTHDHVLIRFGRRGCYQFLEV